ncbi:MAG: ABC transporter ATP-binding protein [Hyphomicrobiaceae bacterium]|nr:ABC transporter ATP-binding protein [Hyphomicrobiaceae bacterium]
MTAELAVSRLNKTFLAGRPAIDDVSFVATAGEIVVLLGPSGCGKTTTMRSVAGLETPTSGQIRIGDDIVSDPAGGIFVRPQKRNVGMVFQSYAVWPHMTVAENVRYPLLNRRLPRAEMERRVAGALAIVSLTEYAGRSATALSGGQMQRVALARSLVYQPRLLLLDEPLSNLDAKLRLRLRDELRRIIKDAGVTALYVTHDQSEAVAVADRIGVMRDGRLIQLATPTELYTSPSSLFVAEFTGATNLISGRIIASDAGAARVAIAGGQELASRVPQRIAAGTEVTVAVRPENLRLSAGSAETGPAGHWNRVAGMVREARFQGVQTAYTVTSGETVWEINEYGSVPRHAGGDEVIVWVPRDGCWAYAEASTSAQAH